MTNSDTAPYQLNQFACWHLFSGIKNFLKSADMDCKCGTLLDELERLRQWDQGYGGYYDPERYEHLAAEVRKVRAEFRRESMYPAKN